jgi:hypothetical protein
MKFRSAPKGELVVRDATKCGASASRAKILKGKERG